MPRLPSELLVPVSMKRFTMPSSSHLRPVAVDLFAGAGGLSLGLEQAGFDVVAAVELDPVHAAIHHYNFPETRVFVRSVTDLSGPEILEAVGRDRVDLVAGGAPCQGFSMIGQRSFDDPRNRLVADFARLVVELDASYFLFENVKGLTVGQHRRFLAELCEEFSRLGYEVVLPWRVLNASSFGVPQSRERLFLLGARKGLPLPKYPEPTHWLRASDGELGLMEATPTAFEAIGDLPDVDTIADLLETDEVLIELGPPKSDYAARLRGTLVDPSDYSYPRPHIPNLLTSSARTLHSQITKERFRTTIGGTTEPVSRFFKLHPEGIANTLRAGTDSSRGAFTSPRPIHYEFPRCITVREMARLHSYPDWFRFHRTKWHGAREVGNSVPPRLAKALGEAIIAAAGMAKLRPSNPVHRTAEPELLGFTLEQAATYWNIENPISGRTLRGTYRKRSQAEVEAELRTLESGGR